ncbi:hypothetical protein VOLCADRAFT_87960 [Volvox carteri f. nagariensis]|uniref:Uncharacterized protein n=1 Tax=Volvox carteri f. nagariensis TaxID=3068 RepID=D8TMQ0_VOLCA|nr:uncharacterized protein VOLCADRAFT_87960 [Volvox carteri f. nagariensis]EFJ51165.1 hypothetical protein VOLCADRAFT_87960 [Volvox carteri f. nagariensis]|eukprot:XP_002947632.1 hypothetical protein VOLCADRAFT_87960 [Volvox carteri f. nagariensis]
MPSSESVRQHSCWVFHLGNDVNTMPSTLGVQKLCTYEVHLTFAVFDPKSHPSSVWDLLLPDRRPAGCEYPSSHRRGSNTLFGFESDHLAAGAGTCRRKDSDNGIDDDDDDEQKQQWQQHQVVGRGPQPPPEFPELVQEDQYYHVVGLMFHI